MASEVRARPTRALIFGRYAGRGLLVLVLLLVFLGFVYWQLSKTYRFHWLIPLQFIPDFNQAILVTLQVSAAAGVLALVLGVFVALARLAPFVQLRDLGALYVHTFRNIPFFVLALLAYFGLGRAIDIEPLIDALGISIDQRIFWGTVALAIFEGAFIAEVIRAGIIAVPKPQTESARSLGMTYAQTMRYIVLPQAFRNIIPALTNELIALVKESSLLFYISVQELTLTARQLAAHQGATFEFYTILAGYYLMITVPIAILSHRLERRMAVGDRG